MHAPTEFSQYSMTERLKNHGSIPYRDQMCYLLHGELLRGPPSPIFNGQQRLIQPELETDYSCTFGASNLHRSSYCHDLGVTTDGGLEWWLDWLTTCTQRSEIQVITAPPLISTLYNSVHAKPSPLYSVFTSRCLVTALNNRDSSPSVFMSLLSGEYSTTELSA
jgi:hypothetical protein